MKDTLKRMKRQGIGWERHMQITYLMKDTSEVYKELRIPAEGEKISFIGLAGDGSLKPAGKNYTVSFSAN